MNMSKKSKDTFKAIGILQNATVVYTDEVKEQFDAIRITDKWIIIGRVLDGEFMDCGFISRQNIKEIKNGNKRKIMGEVSLLAGGKKG